jgi:cell division protein FtsL
MVLSPKQKEIYYVIDPLYADPEQKCTAEGLMKLGKGRKVLLVGLQVHLTLMSILVLYHIITLATTK